MAKYNSRKRTYKSRKSAGSVAKRAITSYKKKSLIKLIKNVSLKQTETKCTHWIYENVNLYHNSPSLSGGHLATTQGVAEDNSGSGQVIQCRIGDRVYAKGLSYKFWFANKLDRPNVMYKIVFFRYQAGYTLTANDPYCSQGTTNYMIRDLDTEKFKILKVKKFNLQNNAQRVTSQDTFQGAEGHRAVNVWIPLKYQLQYENGSQTPKFTNIGFSVVAYDSYGTLLSDNIGSFAYSMKFYFKDP